jgi:hypothetical protein
MNTAVDIGGNPEFAKVPTMAAQGPTGSNVPPAFTGSAMPVGMPVAPAHVMAPTMPAAASYRPATTNMTRTIPPNQVGFADIHNYFVHAHCLSSLS